MNLEIYRCKKCGTPIQGNAVYCVLCFSQLHGPCPECMEAWRDGTWHVKKRGRPLQPIDCAVCNNERWIPTEP